MVVVVKFHIKLFINMLPQVKENCKKNLQG